MARKTYNLAATTRTGNPHAARRAGRVPAVIYGQGIASEQLELEAQQFRKVLAEAGYASLVTLELAGQERNVLVKDVQYHPLKDQVLHADLYQVRMDQEVTAEVPIVTTGESVAVKDLGGVLVRNIDRVEVEALPQNLPHEITVDIAKLIDFESVITIADLTLPEGVKILSEPENVVVLVQEPRGTEELEKLSEAVTEDVQAVEGVKDVPKEEAEPASVDEKKE